ncbi:MAG TPA: class I SAM-dependent methyltransferase, partial [Anaeromyxobacteraceae bacterium]|nr:class I SAM-dependent methyltransferase [Anaeromyxobacteraceae bacterium]
MSTPNPWTVVPAADYERHMGPEGVDQLAPLSALFQEAYLGAQPDRVLLVGSATGNGLEHVDPSVTRRVVGLDVNLQYLGVTRQRFFHLGPRLELYCTSAAAWRSPPQSFDLVHAALVFEYLHPEPMVAHLAGWLAEKGACSVVLQLPGGEGPAPASKALELIQKAMRLVPPDELVALFAQQGLALRRSRVVPLKYGKSFWFGTFGR